MATRLASHYPTHDWSQPRSVDVSALHGGAGVQRTGDGRGTHRRTRQAFMPRFPLRVSKESTAKNPTAKVKLCLCLCTYSYATVQSVQFMKLQGAVLI